MTFNPFRFAIARKRRMLNKKALAVVIGVNPHTIGLWEKGATEPGPDNVEAFVRILGYPTGFFYGPDIDEPNCQTASFRSQSAMSACQRDAALAAGSIGFLLSDWVEERFDLPNINIPDLHLCEPEEAAHTLRQEWGLGEKPVSNMIHLLESKGARVFSLAQNTTRVNAYSLWRHEKPYVFLNTIKSAECSRFDAAHELGHLVLHQDGSVTGRLAEEQANRFASSFLMPKVDVLSVLPQVQELRHIIRAKQRWRVSLAALNYRLFKLDAISEWKNRDFCVEMARLGYNKSEPFPIERENSAIWEKVIKALWIEKTTHFDIARELDLPVSEVCDLLFGVLTRNSTDITNDSKQITVIDHSDSLVPAEANTVQMEFHQLPMTEA